MATMDRTAEPSRSIPIRHVLAVGAGNALGFYDFLTYIYFAKYIGAAFFPSGDPTVSLLAAFAASFIGFIARPVGAMVIGPLGDRIGRKAAMMLSFILMGLGVVGVALTPSYARIGIAAPVLVIVFRIVQGFALGGEVGPTTAYLVEAAPPLRRGLYASGQYATQDLGVLVAGVISTALASQLSEHALQDWGWRAVMLIGVCIVPFGLWLRRSLPETLHAADDAALAPDATTGDITLPEGRWRHARLIALGLMMLTAGTIGSYVGSYMTVYAQNTLHMAQTAAFGIIIVNGGFAVLFEPVSGWLSDRFGRKPVMLIPGAIQLCMVFPAFWCITHYGTVAVFYVAIAVVTILQSLSTPPVIVVLTEQLPRAVRSGVVAIVYAFAISIFGGSTQWVITKLIQVTHDPLMPAYYWSAALAMGLVAMALVGESAPVKTRPK
jgi:MFS family permease